jgi:hypothetical protein
MGVFGMRSIGFLRLNVGVTLPLPLAIFSSLEGVVPAAALAAAARPNDGVRIPPLRGSEVDGAWFPDGVTGRVPGATGKGTINPSASFLRGEGSSLFEGVALTDGEIAYGKDIVLNSFFGDEETRKLVKGDDFTGLWGDGRSAKGMTGIDESASRGLTPTTFDLVADGAGVGSPEASEECICNVLPSA